MHAIKGSERLKTVHLSVLFNFVIRYERLGEKKKEKKEKKNREEKNYITVHTVELITYLSSKTHSAGAASITLSLISITLLGELQSEWKLK